MSISLKKSEITKDNLMIFIVCYEYALSFFNVLKLYNISSKYFWVFLEIISPMLKMGVRKASNLRKSMEKMTNCLKDPSLSYELLTPREEKVLELFKLLIEDNFSDGDGCLHISQFESIATAKAYGKNGLIVASSYKEYENNLDRIYYIEIGDIRFYKTSRLEYYIEKYCEDLSEKDIEGLSIQEIMNRINEGAERVKEQEEAEYEQQSK